MLSETLGVAFMGHFQCVTTKYFTEKNKENGFDITVIKYLVHCLCLSTICQAANHN